MIDSGCAYELRGVNSTKASTAVVDVDGFNILNSSVSWEASVGCAVAEDVQGVVTSTAVDRIESCQGVFGSTGSINAQGIDDVVVFSTNDGVRTCSQGTCLALL